jgi:hypothetical protein
LVAQFAERALAQYPVCFWSRSCQYNAVESFTGWFHDPLVPDLLDTIYRRHRDVNLRVDQSRDKSIDKRTQAISWRKKLRSVG